ncbi:MAG: thioredoxin family protein [Fibrobacterota bacterium]
MIFTSSKILPLGSELPDFWLPDVDGTIVASDHLFKAPAVLVVFMCNHSPFVIHLREVLVKLVREFQQKGVRVVAINPNDITLSPQDAPVLMKEESCRFGYTFPYLFDGTQEVARTFRVAYMPDFFVFNRGGKLVYHGQMDESRPGNGTPVTAASLREALEDVLRGKAPETAQKKSEGCAVQWREGRRYASFYRPYYQSIRFSTECTGES